MFVSDCQTSIGNKMGVTLAAIDDAVQATLRDRRRG